jgi:hypothetical protein
MVGRFLIKPSIYFVTAHCPGATRHLPEQVPGGVNLVLSDALAGHVGSPLRGADSFG